MCSTAAASSSGKPGICLDLAADPVVAERDLAVQLAEVGQVDRQRVRRVGVELADVVQQGAGDRDVAVDVRERRRDHGHGLADAQRVLEQPVPVGLVVALGGGRVAERRPGRRVGPEHAVEQRAQVRVLDLGDQVAQRLLHVAGRPRRAVEQVARGRTRAPRPRAASAPPARGRGAGARSSGPRPPPARPASHTGTSSDTRSRTSATTAPVRSPSVSRRYSPSPFERSSRSRTSSTCSMSWPSTSSRTNMARNARAGGGRLHGNIHAMPTALITGGTGGLGVSVVEAFLAAGWRVVVTVHRRGRAGAAARGGRGRRRPISPIPTTSAAPCAPRRATTRQPLRALANLVGGFKDGQPVVDTPFDRLRGACSRSTCARPTSSPSARCRAWWRRAAARSSASPRRRRFEPWAGGSGYAASKAAVAAFARAVAKEHADDGVRCNVIVPTMIDTPANRAANPDAKMTPPERSPASIRFLCSDESAALNGARRSAGPSRRRT